MIRKTTVAFAAGAVALAVGSYVLGSAARAGDGGANSAPAVKPSALLGEHPFVKALLGAWTTASTDAKKPMKGTATCRLALGGRALLIEKDSGEGDDRWQSLHVFRRKPDGGISTWWFESLSSGVAEGGGWLLDDRIIDTLPAPDASTLHGSQKNVIVTVGDRLEYRWKSNWSAENAKDDYVETWTRAK